MTKTNTNKELARRLHKEVWEEGNLDFISSFLAVLSALSVSPDFKYVYV